MKRVLCVVSKLNTGGAETFLMKILRTIDRQEYVLDFIVSADGLYDEEVLALGGKVYKIPLRTERPIQVFKEIKRIVKENKYRYFMKLCDTPVGILDVLAAKAGGAKRITVRSCNAATNSSWIKERVYGLIRPFFNALIHCKIAPSTLAAKYTFGKNAVKKGEVARLNNGVDLNVYRFDPVGRKKIRDEFDIDDDTLLLGHIGRFSRQKNHKFLIEVFAQYHGWNKNAKLMLVGEGELKNEIQELVKRYQLEDAVIFTGVRRDIPQILSAMDVFVFPSFHEGMPNTVIEAQATGLPVVLADTITKEADITGLLEYRSLAEPADDWAEAVISKMQIERTDHTKAFVDNRYDIQSVVEQFITLVF